MKRVIVLLLVLVTVLTGCATGTPGNPNGTAAVEKTDSNPGNAGTTGENGTTEETTQPGSEVAELEIKLMDGEKIVAWTTVNVPAMIGDQRTAVVNVALLSTGDGILDGKIYLDYRDADGNVVCFRRFSGVGFVAVSDYGIHAYFVNAADAGMKTIKGNYWNSFLSDTSRVGAPLEKIDFVYVISYNVGAARTTNKDPQFSLFTHRAAKDLADQKNLKMIAEIRMDGTKRLVDPAEPIPADEIDKLDSSNSTDYAGFFH